MIRVACWEDERRAKQQNVAPTLLELRSTPSLVPRAVGIAKVGLGRNPCLLSSLAPELCKTELVNVSHARFVEQVQKIRPQLALGISMLSRRCRRVLGKVEAVSYCKRNANTAKPDDATIPHNMRRSLMLARR